MTGKVVVLLDWALELKLSNDEQLQIKQDLIQTWRGSQQAEIRGASSFGGKNRCDFLEQYPQEKAMRVLRGVTMRTSVLCEPI